jgi:hypothetical protein
MDNNLQVTCPIHKEGQERKPSCGISRIKTNDRNSGLVHCFTCGYSVELPEMISNCFGYNDLGVFGTKWLMNRFVNVEKESRGNININFDRQKEVKSAIDYVSDDELEKYRFYHPYMYKRKLTDEIIDKFDVGYDDDFKLNGRSYQCITFPVRDATERVLFIARRSIKGKMFNYPEGVNKPVYGVYELDQNDTEVIVCESIINALTCYVYGRSAVALLGLGTKDQYEQLKRLSVRKYIMAFDGDKAGMKASENFRSAIGGYKLITQYVLPSGKDINDLSEKEFQNLQEIF